MCFVRVKKLYFFIVTNLATEKRLKAKHLKAKKLQRFIEKTKKQVLAKCFKNKNKTVPEKRKIIKKPPIEYQKFNFEALESSLLESGLNDEKPILIFENENHVQRVLKNNEEIQSIVKSFKHVRDILETIEQGRENEDSFRLVITKF